MATASGSASGSPPENLNGTKRRTKKRIRSFTADERACHSAIEKQRREALNASFIDLARLIPALAPVHRLSKSLIVHEGIQYLQAQREMCLAAASEIQAILAENIELTAEVNSWREQYGVAGMAPRQVRPVSDAILALLKVDQQVLGTFPAGFGDNGTGEERDDQGVENGITLEMEEQRDTIQSEFPPQAEMHPVSNTGLNFLEDGASLPEAQQFLAESTPLSEMMRIPDSYLEANGISTQQTRLTHEDIPSSLDNGYDISLPLDADLPPSSNFAELNLHQNIFHEFAPEMGYYLAPENDISDFGYMP
ncbi:hypothetical protein EG329_011858 [Mollisiaceae sp. DMI_Dod_QoI]|nr:hypothetical protein EG329_011858 [Helotiales sp. DMI_Dod_QoI]